MDAKTVIRLIHEAAKDHPDHCDGYPDPGGAELDVLMKFAELVAALEREACAAVCDAQTDAPECQERAEYCAEAIRMRSKV